jgi:enamine deaminase RidA (YjgF/YER057c/UK114 family)
MEEIFGRIRRINPSELGAPPGYSHVVDMQATRTIFIAGQTALDRSGALVGRNDFSALVEVSRLYGPDFLLEIEAIAAV